MRGSGKTFRAVLRAVADASEGKFVIFVTQHRHDSHVLSYINEVTHCLHDCVYLSMKEPQVEFRTPGSDAVVGRLRITDIESFQRDVRIGRYSGLEKRKLKVYFDDCGPDEYLQQFLAERAHG